jgi:hypothetical protein
MANFFRDMSHGRLDLSGSQIFPYEDGWFTLTHTLKEFNKVKAEYNKWAADPKGVQPLNSNYAFRIWAEEAAAMYHPDIPKVDLTKFSGVVAVANVGNIGTVGWIGEMRVICDEFCVKPSILGQEMAHGYGLDHGRIHNSTVDYLDPYDIMSTRSAYSDRYPDYDSIGWPVAMDYGLSIGPGLNAANMDSRGWLDYSRVKKITYGEETVELRPLHRLDLPGFLAIVVEVVSGFLATEYTYIDKFFVEFRMNEGWDGGFNRGLGPAAPVVLIHYFEENNSYIMTEVLRKKGDKFEIKEGEHHLNIQLLDIDVVKRTARITLKHSPISVPSITYHMIPWEYISPAIPLISKGLGRDIAIVNEKITRTPQWSLRPILKSLADISSSYQFSNEASKKIRQESLQTIIRITNEELKALYSLEGVALPLDWSEQSEQSQQSTGEVLSTSSPIAVLNLRFAKGEISKEEYENMRKIIES